MTPEQRAELDAVFAAGRRNRFREYLEREFASEVMFGEVRADRLHVADTLQSWIGSPTPVPDHVLAACVAELKRFAET